MLFLVRFPSQRSGTPYYPNLDSIATCPPPPSPSSAQLNSPSPPGSDVILQEGVRLVSFCLCACMRWLAGRLAVGDKRTLLLRPVAQPRQSLYYIHRGWSAVNRDERGKRSDNCCFFFSKHRRHMQGRFPELSSSGEVTVVRRWVTVENPRCGPRRSAPQGPQRFGSGFGHVRLRFLSTRVDLCPPLPCLPSPLSTPSLDHPRLCALVAIFLVSVCQAIWLVHRFRGKRKWFRAPWYCELMVIR